MKKRVIASLLALPLAVPAVHAQDNAVRISGFGSGALTWTNTDRAEFGRPNQASGADKHVTTGVDSNLGLQADAPLNSWLSATAQGLVRKDAEDDFGAELTLAFAKAKLSDEFSVRVGRMGLPIFMISDYRNVGYANTFLRPPTEMYSQVVFNHLDGVDGTWQHAYGDTNLTAQLGVGRSKADLAGGLTMKGDNVTVLNLVAEHGPLTMRIGRADTKISIDNSTTVNGLLNGLRAAGSGYRFAQLNQLADDLQLHRKKASFTSAGIGLDWNDIIVQSEYAKRKIDGYANDTTSWYAMAGYRVGKFLPYYLHSSLKIDSAVANTVPGACPAGYPAACAPTLAALSNGVNRLKVSGVGQGEQETDSIGVRWDFYRSVALKAQVDRVRPQNGTGLLIAPQPGFRGPVTVGAVSLDFVF
ncbi:hypothetical protein HH212_03335 [Massilia forsythiae]|uniref:Porin n=1 Tax=Massilia forsythiae TaxID=2728020 RepID=A0A7Z2ZSQ0_9BURK|nr:hypothetical protein [Massilia forsythiae]QJD99186.1 hypothetical protein HH212_03335 [Massilia forsythiae]